MTALLLIVALSAALALMTFGGGFYEVFVVDPAWPTRPDIVQINQGGLNRKRFWIPAHFSYEIALIASLVLAWSQPSVQRFLWIALASHTAMRIWSALDFIPKALAIERAAPGTLSEETARRWTRRSWWRFPLDLLTCVAMVCALASTARL
jgi:hypothetical protein